MMRPYVEANDRQRLIEFRRACSTRENSNDYPTVVDLDELLDKPPSHDTERIAVWEDEKGAIVAYAIVALKYCNLYFLLHPQARLEIEAAIIEWGIHEMQDAGICNAVDSPCRDTDLARLAILERHGFAQLNEQTLHMARSLTEPIPPPVFPEGFRLRPVKSEREVEAVVALHQEAFGTKNMTHENRLSMMRNPEYVPELDLLLVAPDETLAAFCYCIISREANEQSGCHEGEVAIVGTRPGYQKRGLGQMMTLAGMQRLKDFGVETATLGTSSENTRAQSVFTSVGFRTVYRTLWYAKHI